MPQQSKDCQQSTNTVLLLQCVGSMVPTEEDWQQQVDELTVLHSILAGDFTLTAAPVLELTGGGATSPGLSAGVQLQRPLLTDAMQATLMRTWQPWLSCSSLQAMLRVELVLGLPVRLLCMSSCLMEACL